MTTTLQALAERFRVKSAADADAIEAAMGRADIDWNDLTALVHGLAGAAGIFGYPGIGGAARTLDEKFAAGLRPTQDEMAGLVDTIRSELARHS